MINISTLLILVIAEILNRKKIEIKSKSGSNCFDVFAFHFR